MNYMNLKKQPNIIEHFADTPECYIVLPGSSGGLHHPLMKLLFDAFVKRGESVVAMEYPYQTNGGVPPENDLTEEIEALKVVVKNIRRHGYDKIRYVCKSLGGLVATWALEDPILRESCISIDIFGFVVPRGAEKGVDVEFARDKIRVVVQGELDDYGNAVQVERYIKQFGCSAQVVKIDNADHSYRHLGSRTEPTHEAEAIERYFKVIDDTNRLQ
jgi:predicted alpha/beta-hydrolase family hydrolase